MLTQVLFCEFCEIFKNTFSYRTTPVAAYEKRWMQRTRYLQWGIYWLEREEIINSVSSGERNTFVASLAAIRYHYLCHSLLFDLPLVCLFINHHFYHALSSSKFNTLSLLIHFWWVEVKICRCFMRILWEQYQNVLILFLLE